MKIENAYSLIPHSKKDILRKLLVKFAKEEEIDEELLKKEFTIEQYEKEYLVFFGNATCDFTCSIGYNRVEHYIEMETKQKLIEQPDGKNKWVKVSEPVSKERIVTDWQPFSGEKQDNVSIVLTPDGDYVDELLDLLSNTKYEIKEDVIHVEENMLDVGKDYLKEKLASIVRYELPGDTVRGFSSSGSASIIEVRRFFVPFYRISYTHKEKIRSIEINACKENFSIVLDEHERKKLDYEPLDTEKIAAESCKVLTIVRNIFWITICSTFFGSIILGPVLRFELSMEALFWEILFFIVAIVITVIRSKMYENYKAKLDQDEKERKENILNEKHKQVYQVLCQAIEKNDLEAIAYEEVY